MSDPVEKQMAQLQTVYASLFQFLMANLVTSGALPEQVAIDMARAAEQMLRTGPVKGEVIDGAALSFSRLAEGLRKLPS